MDIRSQVSLGRSVRVRPLAVEAGIPASSLYTLIAKGKVDAIRAGRSVLVTASAARQLLGMAEPMQAAA